MPGKTGIVTGGSQICGSPFCIPRLWESRMSQNRKLLKVFSLIQVLVAVFALVLGFVTIGSSEAAAGTTVDVFGMQLEGGMWTMLCGGLSIATGVLTFISAALGIRCSGGLWRPAYLDRYGGRSHSGGSRRRFRWPRSQGARPLTRRSALVAIETENGRRSIGAASRFYSSIRSDPPARRAPETLRPCKSEG